MGKPQVAYPEAERALGMAIAVATTSVGAFLSTTERVRVPRRGRVLVMADAGGLVLACVLAAIVSAWLSARPVPSSVGRVCLAVGRESVLFTPVGLLSLQTYGLYGRDRRRLLRNSFAELRDIIHAMASCGFLAVVLNVGIRPIIGMPWLSTNQLILPALAGIVTIPTTRALCSRYLLRGNTRPARVIIVGTGTMARRVARYLSSEPGVYVVGFADDEPMSDTNWLGNLDQLPLLCEKYEIDRVMVTFSRTHPVETVTLLRLLHGKVPISTVPRYFDLLSWRSQVEEIYGLPTIDVAPATLSRGAAAVKRAFDIVGAGLALLVSAPLLLCLAMMVKLSSPGPVVFRQARTGRNGEEFTIYKFRSMRMQAEQERGSLGVLNEVDGPLFKMREDPRVTAIGRLLRRTSLDELPQLANVVKGDMSLVGPRPFVVEESALIEGWAAKRFEMRPGLTGMWQISGRNDLTYDELCRLDYLYVASWSLWWDLWIIWRTPGRVLRRLGAY
jgi:exopolysaccharide biosynthesis polyprenyl glycosylphosphotransferase